ncbi:hypothetical protein [Magnetococcus sp. PR-3]|uniref:hypothetical protein n=1 Tax=Magnetococcus sp. PR-3 TaxID=3120355 RepID=UPI002FCE0767
MLRFLLILFVLCLPSASLAQSDDQNRLLKLNDIHQDLSLRQQRLIQQEQALKQAKTDKRKAQLRAQLDDTQKHILEQEKAFELIVTGGETLARLEGDGEKKKFDWQSELLEIVQPIMSELRKMTEQQRMRDTLSKRILFHQERIAVVQKALEHLNKGRMKGLSTGTQTRFKQVAQAWQVQLKTHTHLLEVDRVQLSNLEQAAAKKEKSVGEKLHEFLMGRGLTLALALGAALTVYLVMRLLRSLLRLCIRGRSQHKLKIQRVMAFSYQSIAVLFSIIAMFYIFNLRGDRAMQAVAILVVVAVIWVLRTSIPRYVEEVRLLLNFGEVREGERILYKNLPWEVASLNLYTTLRNPCIQGETLLVPLSALLNLRSRLYDEDEAWFPCAMGEYVLLKDGLYGEVIQITDEQVRVRLEGGAEKRYGITPFLATNPVNLSKGFGVETRFGVDYQHLTTSTTDIPRQLAQSVRQGLQARYGEAFLDLSVHFDRAADSSLDYRIFAQFTGQAAQYYPHTYRDLQQLAVERAIEQGWKIPYTQLVIHQA